MTLLSGCDVAVSHPEGSGFPTVSAWNARIEGEPPSARLVLTGARDVLVSDTSQKQELGQFRGKTVVVLYSKQRAIALASVADLHLSVGAGPEGTRFDLGPGDYDLVSVADDGTVSYLDTVPLASISISK